jgi:hypothetical protein
VTIVGDTIVAGAPGATVGGNPLQGEAYVFLKPIGAWKDTTETAELTASDGQGQDLFADSISISRNTLPSARSRWLEIQEKRGSLLCLRVAEPI